MLETPPSDKDILGSWKVEGSDTYARCYGGRAARLQATFANAARGPDHYKNLDEREIASGLKDWLVKNNKLDVLRATQLTEELATYWRRPLGAPGDVTEALPVGEPASHELDEEEAEANSSDE